MMEITKVFGAYLYNEGLDENMQQYQQSADNRTGPFENEISRSRYQR
jgi:hypothetical protein